MNALAANSDRSDAWTDVMFAATVFAIAPFALGGVVIRGRPGPIRDRLIAWIHARLPPSAPSFRIPLHIGDDRLLGGIALAETLHSGRVVFERGLLAQCDHGVAIVAMAERLEPRVAAQLCAVLDRGQLAIERDGLSTVVSCESGLIVLDEGVDDERIVDSLRDRLALEVDLDGLDPRACPEPRGSHDELAPVRARLGAITIDAVSLEALSRGALRAGVTSVRAVIHAARVARIHAAIAGRERVEAADLELAARLVLGPRALHVEGAANTVPPASDDAPTPAPSDGDGGAPTDPESADPHDAGRDGAHAQQDALSDGGSSLEEVVLAAARCGVPGGLLRVLPPAALARGAAASVGQSGASRVSLRGGRPAGTECSPLQAGARLAVLDTLRAAAPWQRLRNRSTQTRLQVRKEDFRVRRFVQRTETCVIFAVDASGSAAMQRLAEAKGAVECLLSDCYVRRDHVALVVFRAARASLVLPPTRSLARVRRRLGELAGGGTTPLAAGIDAARRLAEDIRRRGRAPLVVLLTDGRGNVARNGSNDATAAKLDALDGARRLGLAGVPALVLDTSPRAHPRVRALAAEMNARYVALPYFDAAQLAREVRSLAKESAS